MNEIENYINQIPVEKKEFFLKLRNTILKNLSEGFEEQFSYKMIGYVVPKSVYPNGYHCNTKLPLPFVNIACQKNFISIYHMGIYLNNNLMTWFINEFPKYSSEKLDLGKSCIRFKKAETIPFELIAELIKKVSVQDWIQLYESKLLKK